MSNQPYSHIKKIIGNYAISYGVIQSINNSCDSIDCFKIDDNKIAIYLADLAGGIDDKATLTLFQDLINTYVVLPGYAKNYNNLEPTKVLESINHSLCLKHLGKYITLIYGILDLSSNVFEYSVAGYYPNPILVGVNIDPKYLVNRGYPLGVLATATFEKFQVNLSEDQSLVFFSDGIMKFFKPNSYEKMQDDALLQLICNCKIDVGNILEKLHLTYSTPVIDDIVIMTITRNNHSA